MPPLTRFGAIPCTHVPDVLAKNLKVVFCGTALGFMSAQKQAYYAHPGNLFWKTLHHTGLTPRQFLPEDFNEVLAHGIGLTDLCKNAYGLDNQLPRDALDASALQKKIVSYQPRILAFTSKTAASAFLTKPTGRFSYGMQAETYGPTRLFVLPSPSGQARVYWNVAIWQDLASEVRSLQDTPLASIVV